MAASWSGAGDANAYDAAGGRLWVHLPVHGVTGTCQACCMQTDRQTIPRQGMRFWVCDSGALCLVGSVLSGHCAARQCLCAADLLRDWCATGYLHDCWLCPADYHPKSLAVLLDGSSHDLRFTQTPWGSLCMLEGQCPHIEASSCEGDLHPAGGFVLQIEHVGLVAVLAGGVLSGLDDLPVLHSAPTA